MNESYELINISSKNDIVIYQNEQKEKDSLKMYKKNELPKDELNNEPIIISPQCIFFKIIFFIFVIFIFIFFKNNLITRTNDIPQTNNNQIELNKEINEENNKNEDINFENINNNNNPYIYQEKIDHKSLCKNLDPIAMFNLRIKKGPKTICQKGKSKHICYQNLNNYYNDILWHANGTICLMNDIILDPSKSEKTNYIYKGPVDPEKQGFPRLSKGFFNMDCDNPSELELVNPIYDTYFNSWNYEYKNENEKIEELAPGKTVFFISRNQDSPNLFHGNSEIVNVISMMNIFNLKPENIQVIFLESITIKDDPFYDIYENAISRGGKPIYINTLKKKYHISSAIHIPINWDSPCFFTNSRLYRIQTPECKNPSLTSKLYNELVDKYLHIQNFNDSFISDKQQIFYYPKSIIKHHKQKKPFTKTVTIQWRKVWPKGRTGQGRLLGNGPELADKLASVVPNNIFIRLVNTASLPMGKQIAIMRNTDYLVGIHGAGLTLSIFMSNKSILHEILHSESINVLRMMSAISGHKTYSDILQAEVNYGDENENVFFNVDEFAESVSNHMKENNFF